MINASLHPVFQRLLAYMAALSRMDWQFEFADGPAHLAGKVALAALRAEQPIVDPTGCLWLAVAGSGHGVPQPVVAQQ